MVGIVSFMIFEERKKSNLTFPDFGASLPEYHQVMGIDVSHHQGHINWDLALKMKIGRDSVQFVYLKLTEGIDFKDKHAEKNLQALQKSGISHGVYHFYSPSKSAIRQARFFANNCPKTTLKPVLDIELQGKLSATALVDSITVFLREVNEILGVNPIIYTYESFYSDFFMKSALEKEWFWIANYTGKSKAFKKANTVAWQFTDQGTIDGIEEKVDLNTAKPSFWKVAAWVD